MMRRPRHGFTLIEVLVAVTIAAVLAAVILNVTVESLRMWRRGQDKFLADSETKLAFDLIERDLNAAVLRTERGGTWLAVDFRSSTSGLAQQNWNLEGIRMKPDGNESLRLSPLSATSETIVENRFGAGSAWLRFVTSKDATSSDPGAPSVVGYQIVRRPSSSLSVSAAKEDKRYSLFRSIVRLTSSSSSNQGTFQAGYDVTASAYNASASSQADPGTVFSPVSADALASNVIDFGVWFYVRDSSVSGGLRRIFPTSSGSLTYRLTNSGEAPEVVDVMLRILTEEGASLIQNIEAGRVSRPPEYTSDDAWWWGVALANSRTTSRRILLNAAPGL